MGVGNNLDWYLDRGCVVVPCKPDTKHVTKASDAWSPEDSRANRDLLASGNAAMVNGSGGVLVVDVDPKNGADIFDTFLLDLPDTRKIQTVTKTTHGFGYHLVFTLPDGFEVRTTTLSEGIEVPFWVMLPGSSVFTFDEHSYQSGDYTYQIVDDREPVEAPLSLLMEVQKGEALPVDAPEMDPVQAQAQLNASMQRLESAGDGERNSVFLAVALPILQAAAVLGKDGERLLSYAYSRSGGSDWPTFRAQVKSAQRRLAQGGATVRGLPSLLAAELDHLEAVAIVAPWRGRTGHTDRKVYLALIEGCRKQGRNDTSYGAKWLADVAGLNRVATSNALERLEKAGPTACHVNSDGFTTRRPLDPSPANPGEGGNIYPLPLKKGRFSPHPLHPLWCSDGLTGRHGHVLDLICHGLTTVAGIAEYLSTDKKTVRDTVKPLDRHGLIVKTAPGTYDPAEDLSALADRLAVELGGKSKREARHARFEVDRKNWNRYRQAHKPATWEPNIN